MQKTGPLTRYPATPLAPPTPPQMELTDDISDTAQPLLNIPHAFLAGIRQREEPCDFIEDATRVTAISSLHSLQCVTWDRVRTATSSDENMAKLVKIIEDGMPQSRHELPETLREYHQFREHLYTTDGVAIYKDRVVIPTSLRQDCLSALHSAHQGVSSMIARAEASVFWPGITSDNHVSEKQMQPLQPHGPLTA